MEMPGAVIVITGASSGFGKGMALRFAEAGVSVVLAARRTSLLEGLASECERFGSLALPIEADVSRREDVKHVAEVAASTFGRIDAWINNAGVATIGRFEECPIEDHIQVIQTDLLGTLYGSFFALQQFRRQSRGILINIASAVGKIPVPYYASYSAAKHGVVGLSGALRQELRQNHVENIHVCTVLPVAMDTPFFEHASNYTGHEAKPIPPIGDPQLVIDVVFNLVHNPADEVVVGPSGSLATMAHGLFPSAVENMLGHHTHQVQIVDAPPAEMTLASVRTPVSNGVEITGGHLPPQ